MAADAATADVSSSRLLLVVLPTSAASSPPNMRRCMANGSSKCRPGFTFSLGGTVDDDDEDDEADDEARPPALAAIAAAAGEVRSNDGIAMRLENFAALSESSGEPAVLW